MLVSYRNNSACQEYESLVDQMILRRVDAEEPDFAQLLVSLPGIYPSTVLERLGYLASTSRLDNLWYRRIVEDSRRFPDSARHESRRRNQIQLPVEHPLDYEWRFGETAAQVLLDHAASLPANGHPVAMLGTPTILLRALETGHPSPTVLIDKNPLVADCFANCPTATVHKCDLLKDPLPYLESSVVIIDPPWYPDYMATFVWAAVELSANQSHLLMSAPPVGTRPRVDFEMKQLLTWMENELGLTLLRIKRLALPYQTPLFERNALRAEGINNIPQEWRRGDLWVLRNGGAFNRRMSRPAIDEINALWHECVLCNVRLKIRDNNCSSFFGDPTLKPLVKYDVLPSVSRRDQRRKQVDVWTSGNRVFTCSEPRLLTVIVQALASDLSPYHEVCTYLQRDMTTAEESLVSDTIDRLMQLVRTECREMSHVPQGINAELAFHNN